MVSPRVVQIALGMFAIPSIIWLVQSYRRGSTFLGAAGSVRRDKEPAQYWFAMILNASGTLILLYLLVTAFVGA